MNAIHGKIARLKVPQFLVPLINNFFFFWTVSISIFSSIVERKFKTQKTNVKITSLKLEKRTDVLGCYIHAPHVVLNSVRIDDRL